MKPERSIPLRAALLSGCFLVGCCLSVAAAPEKVGVYQVPTPTQLESGEQLFAWLFSRESLAGARYIADELGFSWRETERDIVLEDTEDRGWGDYYFSKYFSKSSASGLVIQAPHRYSDRYTGKIAMRVYARGGINSIALNSVSRRTPVNMGEGLAADMAHLPESFHSVYARAFSTRFPKGHLIQVHGFDPGKRLSRQGQMAHAIISTGSAWSSTYLLATQRCFAELGWSALRYPQQVRELGGTKNSVGALMRNLGHTGFTHVELNLETRKTLKNDAVLLGHFASCLRGELR